MVLEEEKSLNVECENIDVKKTNVDMEEGELTDEEETPYERLLKEVKDLKKKDFNIWNDIAKNYTTPYRNNYNKYLENDIPEIDPYGEEVQDNFESNNLALNDLTTDEIDLIFQRRAKLMENPYSQVEHFKRPRMCKYFRDGFCRDGEKCFFSHLLEDSNRKTRLCKFYEYTSCNQSSTCNYWHGEFPCYQFHILKNCLKDKFCKYSHEPLSPYAKEVLEEYEKERYGCKDINKKDKSIEIDAVNLDNPQIDIDFRVWIPKLEFSVDQIMEITKDERNKSNDFNNSDEKLTEIDDSFNIKNIFNSMKVESYLMGKKNSLNWVSAIKHDLTFKKNNQKNSTWARFSNERPKNAKRSFNDSFLRKNLKKPKNIPLDSKSSCDENKNSKSYDRKKVNFCKINKNNF
uniref:Zinc finger protein n=1 Tax=Strongyloides stercoralis TaxID=6248 RepID=A0A0K0EDD1_STRER